jgi:hypothetical protein
MTTRTKIALVAVALAAAGCSKVKSLLGQDSAGPAASASAAQPAAPLAERPGEEAVCTSSGKKTWGEWANQRAGITASRVDGKLTLGVAFGNTPELVVFDEDGTGRRVRLTPPESSPLSKNLKPPKGTRDLQRVTPAKIGGKLGAYADYRDKHTDGRRRIACGAVESSAMLLVFDGKPLVNTDDDPAKPEEPKPEPKPEEPKPEPVAQAPRPKPKLRLPKAGVVAEGEPVAAAPAAPPPAAPPAEPAPAAAAAPPAAAAAPAEPAAPGPKKTRREVRDCRTIVDSDGSVWALGSDLVATEQDGKTKWSMRFFAAPDAGRGYVMLHSVNLPDPPKKLHTFESPVAEKHGDGHVVFARYQGSLFGWTLGSSFRPSGAMRVYRGGYPTLPHFLQDGSNLLVVGSQKPAEDRYEIFWASLGNGTLPGSLSKLTLEVQDPSLAEPTLARAGDQRWLAYQAGSRREARLVVLPVDAQLKAAGRPFDVTPSGATVYESHIFGLPGGKLLAVYIQNGDPGAELVSEVLTCNAKS